MGWGLMGGIGDGLMQAASTVASYGQQQMDMKRFDAAEKARAARDEADRQRQDEIAKITPVGPRRLYSGAEGETRAESVNRFGDVVDDALASPAEAQGFLSKRRAEQDAEAAARRDAEQKQANFEALEAGRNRRAAGRMQDAAPQGPRPEKFQLPNGKIVWITPGQDPGDAVPWERNRNRNSSGSADDWLSQF